MTAREPSNCRRAGCAEPGGRVQPKPAGASCVDETVRDHLVDLTPPPDGHALLGMI
ncbi:MAG: hypothetical protein ACRDRH_17200 [Pseudonocardia sp.]